MKPKRNSADRIEENHGFGWNSEHYITFWQEFLAGWYSSSAIPPLSAARRYCSGALGGGAEGMKAVDGPAEGRERELEAVRAEGRSRQAVSTCYNPSLTLCWTSENF